MKKDIPHVSLGELLTLERRPVSLVPEGLYAEIGVYSFGRGIFHKQARTGLQVGDKQLYIIKDGDLILQITFAWEGAVALASAAEDGMYGSVRFLTFRVDTERCFPRYLLNYFRTHEGVEQLVRISPGSAGRNRVLSVKRISEVMIPLPPLDEQRRIVARIEELFAKIEEARSLREQSLQHAESFITSYHLHLAGGRTVRMSNLLVLREDQESVRAGSSYPQIGIKSFGKGLFAKVAVDGTDTTYRVFNRLHGGMLVLSQVKGWEGAVAVCPRELSGLYASPEYRTFECIQGQLAPKYLAAIVRTSWFWSRLTQLTRGVGARRERTRPEHFLELEIPMPEERAQLSALSILANVHRLTQAQAETRDELDALMPSILSKAFSGEL